MSMQRLHRCGLRPNPSVALTLHPPLTKGTSPTTLSCFTHSLGKQKVVGSIPQIPFGVASENRAEAASAVCNRVIRGGAV